MITWVALAYSLKFLWAPCSTAMTRRCWGLARAAARLDGADPDRRDALPRRAGFRRSRVGYLDHRLRFPASDSAARPRTSPSTAGASPSRRRKSRARLSAASQVGYKVAMLCAGAGALYVAQYAVWRVAYLSMAGLMAVGFPPTCWRPNHTNMSSRRRAITSPSGKPMPSR